MGYDEPRRGLCALYTAACIMILWPGSESSAYLEGVMIDRGVVHWHCLSCHCPWQRHGGGTHPPPAYLRMDATCSGRETHSHTHELPLPDKLAATYNRSSRQSKYPGSHRQVALGRIGSGMWSAI